jgi:glycosyltransferase involved in cell wall biosynthesis
MNALDCLVHPQVGTEAFPGVVLEAFACGKPVIASALDGIPEAFAAGNYGRLTPPEDVAALAAAMSEQVRQPAVAPSESERLHRLVAERFSFQTMAAAVERLYQSL